MDARQFGSSLRAAVTRAQSSQLTWTSRDVDRALTARDALRKLSAAAPVECLFAPIRSLIPFAAAMIEVQPSVDSRASSHLIYDVPEEFISERAQIMDQDPSLPMVAMGPIGIAIRCTDVMESRDFQRLEYTQRTYRPAGLENVTGLILSKRGRETNQDSIVLWLFSSPDVRITTFDECRMIDLIGADLRDAILRRRLPFFSNQTIFMQTIHDEAKGYIVVGSNGRLLEVNRQAVLLAQKYTHQEDIPWRNHIRAFLDAIPENVRSGRAPTYRMEALDESGVLDVGMFRYAKETHDLSEDVSVIQMKETLHPAWTDVFAGLSPRRRQVAMLLGSTGLPNKLIADRLGMAEGTMRKHSEDVHRLLKVNSRFELIELVRKAGRQ